MGWKKKSAIPQIRAAFRASVAGVVNDTPEGVLYDAQRLVPAPGRSRGYATGALKESGYIARSEYEGAAHAGSYSYEEAITAAQAAPDARILGRDQILPEMFVPPLPTGLYMSIVDFPLSYAALIHNGFFHVRAGRHIIGVAFLDSAVNANERDYVKGLTFAVKELEKIGLPSQEERQAKLDERYHRRIDRDINRQLRLDRISFSEAAQRSGEKLQRLRDPRTGRIIETFGEMWERVRNATEYGQGMHQDF